MFICLGSELDIFGVTSHFTTYAILDRMGHYEVCTSAKNSCMQFWNAAQMLFFPNESSPKISELVEF